LIFSVPAAAIIKVFITFTVENITRVSTIFENVLKKL
jgi:hypothetical protein